jgi:ABC-type branched-subunit amino acid transport system substrate-binding protein
MTPDQERDFIERQVNKEISRRHFMGWATKAGIGATAAVSLSGAVLAACGGGGSTKKIAGGGGSSDTLKVGVIAPFSGIGAFIGTVTSNSLNAAVQELNSRGGVLGRKIALVNRDTGIDPANGVKAYNELAGDPNIVGILWCGGLGFEQTQAQFARDRLPVMSVFNDAFSDGRLYPEDPNQRSVFQFLIPTKMAMETLTKYAKQDRGYSTAALVNDVVLDPRTRNQGLFNAALQKNGMRSVGYESYQLGTSDFGPALQRLKSAHPDVVAIFGLSGDSANFVIQIDQLGSAYVDTPTAKDPSKGWHPHIFGSPGGTGDHSWADLAKDSAKPGTLTAWHVGGLVYLPEFAIAGWMKKYLDKLPTGGEESPADGLYTLLKGVEKAGSTDRTQLVNAIETMGPISFASTKFSFTKDRHLSKTDDDMIIVTLERKAGPAATDPPYKLGTEWSTPFARFPAGPTQLVRPTLDGNRRAQPDVMKTVLDKGYGTQCTKNPDGTLSKECKIH